MYYCLVIYLVSLTASRLGDKFNRLMTRDKLLDNNPTLFIFFYSNDDSRDPENRQNRFSERRFSKKKLQPVEWESVAYCSSTEHYRLIIPHSCPLRSDILLTRNNRFCMCRSLCNE